MAKTRTRKRNDERGSMQGFDAAAARSERSLYAAQDALGRLGQARDEAQRRQILGALLEQLMEASYALGLAEGHLRAAGRSDPFKVPRYRQVAELFTDTWGVVRERRVANVGDRGQAAMAAGLTAVAGALLGGLTLGPFGGIVGSIAGGAMGPYAFMRQFRDPEDLEGAMVGGGVGGLFTPLGAAAGAYVGGDELDRSSNPRRANRGPTLPRYGDPPLVITVRGEQLTVEPAEGDWATKHRRRTLWGTRKQTLENIEYFQIYGTLPPSSPGVWANTGKRRRNGWIGSVDAVQNYLGVVGADKDADGKYLIGGDPPIYGDGGREIVLSDEVVYYMGGRPVPLAAALADTSQGVGIRVFNGRRKAPSPTWLDEGASEDDYLVFYESARYNDDFPKGYYDVLRVTRSGAVTGELATGRSEREAVDAAREHAAKRGIQSATVFRVKHDNTLAKIGHAGLRHR
ncbi:MAG: hypothetical protein Q8Q14_07270 [Gemmatimonadales bacterium]|nr:hypothetical protein [Gemmatimonadales bacterium]